MSDFNNKLVVDLFEERDALKADVVRLTLKVAEMYEGAEEQKQRIRRLEEAGDAMAIYAELGGIPLQFVGVVNAWREAKEAKP